MAEALDNSTWDAHCKCRKGAFEVVPVMTSTPLSTSLLCCSAQQPWECPWTQSCGGKGGDPSHSEEAQSSSRVREHPSVHFLASLYVWVCFVLSAQHADASGAALL